MAEGLPPGLVTNAQGITHDMERVDRVAVEDITQLWKGTFPLHAPGRSTAHPGRF